LPTTFTDVDVKRRASTSEGGTNISEGKKKMDVWFSSKLKSKKTKRKSLDFVRNTSQNNTISLSSESFDVIEIDSNSD
jgi:hypothetical protein